VTVPPPESADTVPLAAATTETETKTAYAEPPARLALTPDEAAAAANLVSEAAVRFPSADDPGFLREAALSAAQLPLRLRSLLFDVRLHETAAAVIVSGFPVDDAAIGPTPPDWAAQPDRASTLREEMWLVLCGSLLGDVFGWATQQNGALIHDIAPVKRDEHMQLGSGSADLLWWHTEEAFDSCRCDYLGLLCLRNHDRVPTTFASVGGIELESADRTALCEPRYLIRPDDSHLGAQREAASAAPKNALMAAAHDRIERMNDLPQPVSVLYGDPSSPYLTIDPYYMRVPDDDPQARHALDALSRQLDRQLQAVALEPGEILFIDNCRAVHGRQPFQAKYDGTDRWLKRINVARDLRRSRSRRASSAARVVH
jgi:Fe(II)/alpha-ketoglutarate-dependent arginine beta-hydroxylase